MKPGQILFINAHQDVLGARRFFLCKALVLRSSQEHKNVYKVVIIASGYNKKYKLETSAKQLLGKKVSRKFDQLLTEVAPWYSKTFDTWVELNKTEVDKLIKQATNDNQ
jgi:dTDP-D-glucose 4,6-dehydratase